MNENKIPLTLLGLITETIETIYTSSEIDNYFNIAGYSTIELNTYNNNKKNKIQQTLQKINNQDINPLNILAKFISPIIDQHYNGNITKEYLLTIRDKILNFLKDTNLCYTKNIKNNPIIIQNKSSNQIIATNIITIDYNFLQEQIKKCKDKIIDKDYDGAITNARTLIEVIFKHVLEKLDSQIYEEYKNIGNLETLYSQIKNLLNLDPSKFENIIFKQILGSVSTIIKSIMEISDQGGSDRHMIKYKIEERHTKLLINLTFTITEFIMDVCNNKINKL